MSLRQQIADASAMLDQAEAGSRPKRAYLVGAASRILNVVLADHLPKKLASKIARLELRFNTLSKGGCLGCVAEEEILPSRKGPSLAGRWKTSVDGITCQWSDEDHAWIARCSPGGLAVEGASKESAIRHLKILLRDLNL